eukprot:TRINITY_DN7471_c0_g1_i1.p1 TRINITY_DN7471_c0_g1~~TRINITY_DN7471_c0_g1_i1.p1  ORF type:complete len:658 (-),score=111.30 TRINITY_DN7471_c0_g1_i1:52-2025(-)
MSVPGKYPETNIQKTVAEMTRLGKTNTPDSAGDYLLHVASRVGSKAAVQHLLNSGAKISCVNELGQNPLHLATKKEVVALLLEEAVKQNITNIHGQDLHTWTPLHYAVYLGYDDIVTLLIDSGAPLDEEDKVGRTPLHLACKKGKYNYVLLLLNKGAQIKKDVYGKSPLSELSLKEVTPESVDEDLNKTLLTQDLKKLINSREYSDITFLVGDERVYAHKNIISQRCPQLLEKNTDQVVISDIEKEVFLGILEYLYTGTIEFESGDMDLMFGLSLWSKAKEFGIHGLATYLESLLINNIDESTASTVLTYARTFNCFKAIYYSCYLIVKHFDSLPKEVQDSYSPQQIMEILNTLEIEPVDDQEDLIPKIPPKASSLVPERHKTHKKPHSPSIRPNKKTAPYAPVPIRDQAIPPPKHKPSKKTSKQSGVSTTRTVPYAMAGNAREECKKLLEELMAIPTASDFLYPVDPVALNLPDYKDIIKNPMDLSTVKKKLSGRKRNGYKKLEDFSADVRLIFQNAMLYNQVDSEIWRTAERLKQHFESRYDELKTKLGIDADNYDPPPPKDEKLYTYTPTIPAAPAPLIEPKKAPSKKSTKRKIDQISSPSHTKNNGTPVPPEPEPSILDSDALHKLSQQLNSLSHKQVADMVELVKLVPNAVS